GVGVASVPQPRAVLQHADPGSGEEAHLGRELAGLFAAVIEFFGEFVIEKDYGVADGGAVFGAAETENIDASLPCDFLGSDIEGSDRVGESRAVHVHAETVLFGNAPDG